MLHDLARCLHEVPFNIGPGETPKLGSTQVLVQNMAELVEKGFDLAVLQKGWCLLGGLGEVGDHRTHRILI